MGAPEIWKIVPVFPEYMVNSGATMMSSTLSPSKSHTTRSPPSGNPELNRSPTAGLSSCCSRRPPRPACDGC